MPGTCAPCAPQSDIDLAGAASCAGVTFPITLNDRWRVADDPLQWILEVRRGQAGNKARRPSSEAPVPPGAPIRAVDDYFDFLRRAPSPRRPRPIFFAIADRSAA